MASIHTFSTLSTHSNNRRIWFSLSLSPDRLSGTVYLHNLYLHDSGSESQICINIHQDAVPPIHAESYHVATDKPPPAKDGDKFQSILATIYNQSQLAERKHVARYWLINTVATAVPLSAHPSPLVITTKLAAAILSGRLFGGGALPAQ